MRLLAILIIVFSLYSTDTISQNESRNQFSVGLNLLVRKQSISTTDPGGYLIADQFSQRLSYGVSADMNLSKRFSIVTGIQKIFFITDVNFWFLTSGNIFLTKTNPFTGVQLPVGLKFNLISNESNSRWRIGMHSGLSFSRVRISSSKGYGRILNQSRTMEIEYSFTTEPTNNNFITFDYGFFTKFRLSKRFWANYNFNSLQSFSDQVVINNIQYSVTSGSITNAYEARTLANGSARHHTIGIEFMF